MHQTTSDLRVGLCSAICSAVYAGTIAQKRELAEHLDVLPFERMGDAALLALAQRYVAPERIVWLQKHKSAEHHPIVELVLCRECQDTHVVEVEPDRWTTCRACQRPKGENDET